MTPQGECLKVSQRLLCLGWSHTTIRFLELVTVKVSKNTISDNKKLASAKIKIMRNVMNILLNILYLNKSNDITVDETIVCDYNDRNRRNYFNLLQFFIKYKTRSISRINHL